MDPTSTFDSIARVFSSVSDESVEEHLVVFDSLLNVSDPKYRTVAADVLRKNAEGSKTAARRERLLQAAAEIVAGKPCAFTPDGLSAKQAAEANTVTADGWREPPLPASEAPEKEQEEEDEEVFVNAPPKLPHLPVRHFFGDLVVRIALDFTDTQGNKLQAGNRFTLLRCDQEEDSDFVLIPLAGAVRSIRLNPKEHAEIIENAGNAWFEPVPSTGCLEELCYWIAQELTTSENGLDEESDDYDERIDDLEALRDDVQECQELLEDSSERGAPPSFNSASIAEDFFGPDHKGTAWIRLLLAGIAVTLPD
jgi:hypothetical protein